MVADMSKEVKKQYKESLIFDKENADTEPEENDGENGSQTIGGFAGVNSRAMWHESEKSIKSYWEIELNKALERRTNEVSDERMKRL